MVDYNLLINLIGGTVACGLFVYGIRQSRKYNARVREIHQQMRDEYTSGLQQKGADLDARLGAMPATYQREAGNIALLAVSAGRDSWEIPAEISSVLTKYTSSPIE